MQHNKKLEAATGQQAQMSSANSHFTNSRGQHLLNVYYGPQIVNS